MSSRKTIADAPRTCPGCGSKLWRPRAYKGITNTYVEYDCGCEWWRPGENREARVNESKECLRRQRDAAAAERDKLRGLLGRAVPFVKAAGCGVTNGGEYFPRCLECGWLATRHKPGCALAEWLAEAEANEEDER